MPSKEEGCLARESSRTLAAFIGRGQAACVRLIVGDQEIEVPMTALEILVEILAQMARANAVSIAPIHSELTPQTS